MSSLFVASSGESLVLWCSLLEGIALISALGLVHVSASVAADGGAAARRLGLCRKYQRDVTHGAHMDYRLTAIA